MQQEEDRHPSEGLDALVHVEVDETKEDDDNPAGLEEEEAADDEILAEDHRLLFLLQRLPIVPLMPMAMLVEHLFGCSEDRFR